MKNIKVSVLALALVSVAVSASEQPKVTILSKAVTALTTVQGGVSTAVNAVASRMPATLTGKVAAGAAAVVVAGAMYNYRKEIGSAVKTVANAVKAGANKVYEVACNNKAKTVAALAATAAVLLAYKTNQFTKLAGYMPFVKKA